MQCIQTSNNVKKNMFIFIFKQHNTYILTKEEFRNHYWWDNLNL